MKTLTTPWKAKYSMFSAVDGQNGAVFLAEIDKGSNVVTIREFTGYFTDCWIRGQLIYFTDD